MNASAVSGIHGEQGSQTGIFVCLFLQNVFVNLNLGFSYSVLLTFAANKSLLGVRAILCILACLAAL